MRKLLTLNTNGRLALRSGHGVERDVTTVRPNVLLLIDLSGSMSGAKLDRAKAGTLEFAESGIARGYSIALAVFADRAAMVFDPTADAAVVESKITKIAVGLVGMGTDLEAGLVLANKFPELAAIVVVTDGQTVQKPAMKAANVLKARGTDIICIGTDDADRDFLQRLATRSDLAIHVAAQDLHSAISDASRLLADGR